MRRAILLGCCAAALSGCGVIEQIIFPIQNTPELLSEPPAPPGPYPFRQRRVELDDGGDGRPSGLTVFEPIGAEGPRPALVWVLGVNNRPFFQQSFHEYLASHGWVDIVPDTRDIRFFDTQYHARNVALARRAVDLAANDQIGISIDGSRIAIGGYSIGATMAAFAAAQDSRLRALALWAPSPAFVWQGVDPAVLLPQVVQPSFFLLAEFDNVTPADQWPAEMMQRMSQSTQTTFVIPRGVHLFFQQLSAVDDRNPPTTITRIEQLGIAHEQTRGYLEAQLGPGAP